MALGDCPLNFILCDINNLSINSRSLSRGKSHCILMPLGFEGPKAATMCDRQRAVCKSSGLQKSSGWGSCIYELPSDNLFLMRAGGSETGMAGLLFPSYRSNSQHGWKFVQCHTNNKCKKEIASPLFFLNVLLPHTEEWMLYLPGSV